MNRISIYLLPLLLLLAWGTGAAANEEGSATASPSLLLIAKPEMNDPRFQEAVVLVTRHGGPGTIGVILNKSTGVHLNDVFSDLPELDTQTGMIYFGGPVSPDVLTFLVDTETHPAPALTITENIYLAQDPDLLRTLIDNPGQRSHLRVFSGHAGWATGQLEDEIERGDWWLMPLQLKYLFFDAPDKLWQTIVQELKGKWVSVPANATDRTI